MKAGAEKSSSTTQSAVNKTTASPFFAPARQSAFFAPSVQMKMEVSKPGDPLEKEADHMAGKVMRMASPAPAPAPAREEKLQRQGDEKLQRSPDEKLQKAPEPELKLQKKEEDKLQKASVPEKEIQKKEEEKLQKASQPDDKLQKKEDDKLQRKAAGGAGSSASSVQSAISGKMTGGQPMSNDVRSFMEPRFNADFSSVRIHNDPESASLNNQLSARAFTHKNHIFFSRDQYQPGTSDGKHLLAHELTHTIQQGHAVQRAPQVSTTATPPPVQRLGIQDALDYFADKAANIPGFTMLTVIIGFNPINQRSVDRSAANILRAMVEMVPGGHMISQALDNHGIFNRVGAWAEQQFATLGDIGSEIVGGLRRFIDSLSWTDIFDLGGVWDRAKSIFTAPINRLISFASSLASQILGFIREAILRPLAALAEGTRGYDLLKALLGQDPITGEAVPRTADTLIGGFMKLIGQEEIWENIKKGNAIARAWAWFQGALEGLLGFARSIPQKIIQTITSLTIMDLVTVVGAFRKIVGAFVDIAGSFMSWAFDQVLSLLEILFSVVAPGVMPYLKKAQAAFTSILKNPIGFVGNLVQAGKKGFQMFAGNIIEHLKAALIKWLVGPLADAGVYIPKSFSLMEIIKLVLSVLGLTWQNIRAKLVKIIPEPVLVGLEKTAGILVTLVKDGPAAAWEQIKTELSELKDQLIAQVTQMVSVEIVKAAVMKLVSMLNPAGAVIQAIIAIYNTVTFFIEKINQIAAVVASFIDSISAIAAGQVDAAAKKVETTMANTLTVVIAFLAKFAGLGGIPAKLVGIVKKIRQPIDRGLDKIVAWLGKMLGKMKAAFSEWWKTRKRFNAGKETHEVFFKGEKSSASLMVASNPELVETFIAKKEANAITPQAKTALAAVKASLAKIKDEMKKSEDKQNAALITSEFNAIGGNLAVLMSGEDWGSEENPVLLDYPKPRLSAYAPIYLGPHASDWLPQTTVLQPAFASSTTSTQTSTQLFGNAVTPAEWNSVGKKVKQYLPTAKQSLPHGEDTLGIDAQNQVQVGLKFKYTPSKTKGGTKINKLLKPYGFRPGKDGMDGDHIVEIQLIGLDKGDYVGNLWPLRATDNRHGLALAEQNIELPGTPKQTKKLSAAYAEKSDLWIMVKSTK
ncbi:MAG: DUF4157 domain-containing protein [Chlorobaculum sp.]|nr:DUF4157 domain-containing protein [Chlorobaculum sp.]